MLSGGTLRYVAERCAMLRYAANHRTAVRYAMLRYAANHRTALRYVTLWRPMEWYEATRNATRFVRDYKNDMEK